MPQVNVLPIDTAQSLDSITTAGHVAHSDSESGRRFGDEFERQLAAESSGKDNTQNNRDLKKDAVAAEKESVDSLGDKKSARKSLETSESQPSKTKPSETASTEPTELTVDENLTANEDVVSEEAVSEEVLAAASQETSAEPSGKETSQQELEKSDDFLSFLSAAAKLIPEDSQLNHAQVAAEETALASADTDVLALKEKLLDKQGVKSSADEAALAKLARNNGVDKSVASDDESLPKNTSELSLTDKFSALLNAEKNSVKAQTSANASSENASELKSVEGLRKELANIINSQNASPEEVSQAQSILDNLLANEDELSAKQLKEQLANEASTAKNPVLNQLMQVLNAQQAKIESDKNSEINFIASDAVDKSLTDSSELSSANKDPLKASSLPPELATPTTPASDLQTTEVTEDELVNFIDKVPTELTTAKTPPQDDKSLATFGITNESQRKSNTQTLAASMQQNASNSEEKNSEANIESLINEEGEVLDTLLVKEEKPLSPNPQTSAPILRSDSLASAPTQVVDESTRDEQSLDALLSMVKTDNTVQAPKVLAPQAEVLSMYRKDFSETLKDKVMVMVNQKIQQVDIQLDPPEMGNIHVRVNLQNEQAQVTFNVQNQQAKEALEQNMGKLKDMLSQSGVDVGDANVNQQSNNQGENAGSNGEQSGRGSLLEQSNDMMAGAGQVNVLKASSAGIDYYA